MKKGQVEISFNWIFILIVGGALLLFFVIISKGITEGAGTQTDIKVTERFKTILAASEKNTDSADKPERPLGFELEFMYEFGSLYYRIPGSNADPTLLTTNTIYSPKIIGDSRLISWSKSYYAPYAITTTLLLSDEKTMYLFEEDGSLAENLYYEVPDEFTKLLLPSTEISGYTDEGLRKYVLVETSDNTINNLKLNQKLSILHLTPGSDMNTGKIEFQKYDRNLIHKDTIETLAYVSTEMLLGAVISGDPYLYNCTRSQVLEKSKIITEIYEGRVEEIGGQYNSAHRCSIYYQSSIITAEMDKIINLDLNDFDSSGYNDYSSAVNKINLLNEELLRTSCPLIY